MRPGTALKLSILSAILLACATHSSAQGVLKPSGKQQSEAKVDAQSSALLDSALKSRARELAASTADEALKWDDTQAAVRVLAQTADLLWAEYPERSRVWLMRAWEMTEAVVDEDGNGAVGRFRSNSPRSEARAAVLTVAQKHDQRLANQLLEQLANDKEQSRYNSRRGIFNDRTARSEQLLGMALTFAEREPATAAALAERSLADGVSFQLQDLLLTLRRRDPVAANRVFDAALNRLSTGFTHPSEGQVLASYLFTPGRVIGASSNRAVALAVVTRAPVLRSTPAEDDPARTRRFLGIMQKALLSMPAPSTTTNPSQSAWEFITLSNSLAQGYRLYAPDLWVPIQQRMAQFAQDVLPAHADQRMPSSVRDKIRLGSGADEKELNRLYVEGLEEAAEKERDPLARKLAFVQAALATTPEDLEYGRRIAARIDESNLREQVISHLVYRAALLNIEKNQLDKAVALVADANPLERTIVLVTVARRMTGRLPNKDDEQFYNLRLRALELLSEADKLSAQSNSPDRMLNVRLGLVAALAPLDSVRALELFGNVIAAINGSASSDLSNINTPPMTDVPGASESSMPPMHKGFDIKDTVMSLAHADFEGTVMLITKLNAPAIRGTCMLEAARTVLSTKPVR